MKSHVRLLIACALLIGVLMPVAEAATIENKISQFRLKNETAEYAEVTSGEKAYYIVKFESELSLIFEKESLELVEDDLVLQQVIYDFFDSTGQLGFSDVTAQEINNSFYEAYHSYGICSDLFYEYVENNFFVRDYQCIETNTGKACDIAFSYRANLTDQWRDLKTEVDKIIPLSLGGETDEITLVLTSIRDRSKAIETDVSGFDSYYSFFRGYFLADDPECGYSAAPLRATKTKAENSIEAGITDIKGEASRIKSLYELRRDISVVKDIQGRGDAVMEEAQTFANEVEEMYLVDAVRTKMVRLDDAFDALRNTTNKEDAENAYANMNTILTEMKSFLETIRSDLEVYSQAAAIMQNASTSISRAKTKFGSGDLRVKEMETQYLDLGQRLDNERSELEIGNLANRTQNLQIIRDEAQAIDARARTLPAPESEIDPLIIATVVVLVLSMLGLIYIFRIRKPPKEVDIKELYARREEQHRDVVMPSTKK
ncbi:hypothetical protein KJ765_05660 [Candidatus Micrarchaeota archaeon]|nr:hypothetical protein [Candidatus Micrarchaeota archaeon]